MPKIWTDTIADHREGVRVAVLEATWALASEAGVRGVTMALVAERAGIGRATLYKYFHGVDEILIAAHTEHVRAHLAHLEALNSSAGSPVAGLREMIAGYAHICFHKGTVGSPDVKSLVHTGEDHQHHESRLQSLFANALRIAQETGDVRSDLSARELAAYCVHAVGAAGELQGKAAVERLVRLVWDSLRGPRS